MKPGEAPISLSSELEETKQRETNIREGQTFDVVSNFQINVH